MTVAPQKRRRACRPTLAQTLALSVLLPVLLGLGAWQLHRAGEKSALMAALARAQSAPPIPIDALSESGRPQRVVASGRFAAEQFLLDNRISKGRAGYEQLAPLILADGRAVLVDLGWLPQGADRRTLPPVRVPDGETRVTGLALVPVPPVFRLDDREMFGDGWPMVVQSAQPARLRSQLGYALLPVVLYPDGSPVAQAATAGLDAFPPTRHLAYAVQWFALALWLVVVYVTRGLGAQGRAPRPGRVGADPIRCRRRTGRALPAALGLVFATPPMLALLVYARADWQPADRLEHGVLMPSAAAGEVSGRLEPGDIGLGPSLFQGRWTLLYASEDGCPQECRQRLDVLTRVCRAQPQAQGRVQRVLVAPALPQIEANALGQSDPGLRVLRTLVPRTLPAGQVYLVDPLGNFVLRYPPGFDPRGLAKDLERLLRLSRIG